MQLLSIDLSNFGSYEKLEFDFTDLGLSLVSGPTGSGKSTLQDGPYWVMFGETAKGGNVDEVRSWFTSEPTVGILALEVDGKILTITRIRGTQSQNDLYWSESDTVYRGKDMSETQKLMETRLRVQAESFAAATYFNEFSPAGSFFLNKAKERRSLFDKLVDLNFPATIKRRATDEIKEVKKNLESAQARDNKLLGRVEQLRATMAEHIRRRDQWDNVQKRTLAELKAKAAGYENYKTKETAELKVKELQFDENRKYNIKRIENRMFDRKVALLNDRTCPHCGVFNENHSHSLTELNTDQELLVEAENNKSNPFTMVLKQLHSATNPHEEAFIKQEMATNPYVYAAAEMHNELQHLEKQLRDIGTQSQLLRETLSSLCQISDLTADLRSILLHRSVKAIEKQTNTYLEQYFESAIRVLFDTKNDDSLDVTVTKDGYEATYKQLSKGQRGLLKLCFAVSVMKSAANKVGVHFNLLMLDEALDGLDSDLKVKAFNLLSELEKDHTSILVIDHAQELKSLFNRRFEVSLEQDRSFIREV
jgi:DNA repair exonuclease SbcCD ATPase subunit